MEFAKQLGVVVAVAGVALLLGLLLATTLQ